MSLKHSFPVAVWTLVLTGAEVVAQAPRPLFSTGTDLVVLHATVKDLVVGDVIRLATPRGEFDYQVRETLVVNPDDVWVLNPTNRRTVTLITCYPFAYVGDAPRRFVVRAEQTRPAQTEASMAVRRDSALLPRDGEDAAPRALDFGAAAMRAGRRTRFRDGSGDLKCFVAVLAGKLVHRHGTPPVDAGLEAKPTILLTLFYGRTTIVVG